MKKLLKILPYIVVLYLVIGCKNNKYFPAEEIGSQIPEYILSNRSGCMVSIVHAPECRSMPDSVVLLEGEEFFLTHVGTNVKGTLPLYSELYDRQFIYYNKRYKMNLSDLPYDRDLRRICLYKFNAEPENFNYVFTLTEKDYRYAVENGTDLGESKP